MKIWQLTLSVVFVMIAGSFGYLGLRLWQNKKQYNKEVDFRRAIENHDFSTAQQLINQGVNISAGNPKTGLNALYRAINRGDLEGVKFLLQYGYNTTSLETPLDYALRTIIGQLGVPYKKIQEIIVYLVDLKVPNKKKPPILAAIFMNNFEQVKNLLGTLDIQNLDPKTLDDIRSAAIISARLSRDKKILNYLLQKIPDLDNRDNEGRTFAQVEELYKQSMALHEYIF